MVYGKSQFEEENKFKLSSFAYLPQLVLLLVLLMIGINMPQQVFELINNAAGFFIN
jgi:hypothetical protein